MPIATSCPKCQANFRLPEELAGKQVKCQRCGEVFRAPAPAHLAGDPEIIDARLADESPAPQPLERSVRSATEMPPPMPAYGPDDSSPERPLPRRRAEYDHRPPPRRRRGSGGMDPWVVTGIVGGVMLLIGGVTATVMLIDSRPRQVAFQRPAIMPAPQQQWPPPQQWKDMKQEWKDVKKDMGGPPIVFPNFPNNQPIPPLDVAKAITIPLKKGAFQGNYSLTQTDPLDPNRRAACKLFLVPFEKGKAYVIDHKAIRNGAFGPFDPFLRLETPAGKQVAENDDFGGNFDSRINYTALETGNYRVIATTLGGGFGEFSLAIRDVSTPEAPVTRPLAKIELPQPALNKQKLYAVNSRMTTLPAKTIRLNSLADLCNAADGVSVYVLDGAGLLRQISVPDFVEEKRVQLPGPCGSLAVSGDGLAVAMTGLHECWLIDPLSFQVKKRISTPDVQRVLAAPASKLALAVGANDRFNPFQGGVVTVLDFAKGEAVGMHKVPTTHAALSPDGKYYFAQDRMETLVRYRFDSGNLVRAEASPRIAQNGQRINISPDSKFVRLPSGGGNYEVAGHPRVAYSTYVFAVENLQNPAFTIKSGAYPRVVGFDPAAGYAYAQSSDQTLQVHDYQGNKKSNFGQRAGGPGEDIQQFLALPEGKKLILRYADKLVYAELEKDGQAPAAAPVKKHEVKDAEPVVIKGTLTQDDRIELGKFIRAGKEHAFQFEANTNYRVELSTSGFKGILFVLDENGKTLQVQSGSIAKGSINFRPAATGLHYIAVSGFGKTDGEYTLTVRR